MTAEDTPPPDPIDAYIDDAGMAEIWSAYQAFLGHVDVAQADQRRADAVPYAHLPIVPRRVLP